MYGQGHWLGEYRLFVNLDKVKSSSINLSFLIVQHRFFCALLIPARSLTNKVKPTNYMFLLYIVDYQIKVEDDWLFWSPRVERNMHVYFLLHICSPHTQPRLSTNIFVVITIYDLWFCLSVQDLVDSLHGGVSVPTVLQSLGCLAQHSVSTFESQDQEITPFIYERILQVISLYLLS